MIAAKALKGDSCCSCLFIGGEEGEGSLSGVKGGGVVVVCCLFIDIGGGGGGGEGGD